MTEETIEALKADVEHELMRNQMLQLKITELLIKRRYKNNV
jgi:hypothetical protein